MTLPTTGKAADAGASAGPGVHFPPPLLFIAGFLLGWALERWVLRVRLVGGTASTTPLMFAGTLLIVVGLGIVLWGVATLIRADTTVLPMRAARALVASGPYRFSRNPMYVGMSLAYLGLALRLNVGWPIALLPVVLLVIAIGVIRREERHLAAVFGAEYDAYRRRVRRWI